MKLNISLDVLPFLRMPGKWWSIAFAIPPSLPARPTSCQYTNKSRGAPQWMTVSASNIPIPVPNAKVAITHLSGVPLKHWNTLTFSGDLSCLVRWEQLALSCSSRWNQAYRSLTVLKNPLIISKPKDHFLLLPYIFYSWKCIIIFVAYFIQCEYFYVPFKV